MSQSRSHYVIATAGHVDHGKSTLVRALTGIDPDRLAEEKAREMTIDLGYAWLALPNGATLSIVDVPGHERFIKNMLAGVGGIDAALLVVSADEGFMPQTNEHLAILDLLEIERGTVALTKSDLVDDEWLDFMQEDISARLATSRLHDAPIVPVSAVSGDGLEALVSVLQQQLDAAPLALERGSPRLSIDRVFTTTGHGTVVTGTLIDGVMSAGDDFMIYPEARPVRVRGLQVHNRIVERTEPGNRVAVNLAGIAVNDLRRGDLLGRAGEFTPSSRLDVRLSLLPDAPSPIKQDDVFDFFLAAAELPAHVTLLDRDLLDAGDTGWAQLRFSQRVVARSGDRFIARRASPSQTIGGGEVIDPNPARHRRFDADVLSKLETRLKGDPDELTLAAIGRSIVPVESITDPESLSRLVDAGRVALVGGEGRFVAEHGRLAELKTLVLDVIDTYHGEAPFASGIPRQSLRAQLDIGAAFDALIGDMTATNELVDGGTAIRLPQFRITLAPDDRQRADRWLGAIDGEPFAPASPAEFQIEHDMLLALTSLGEIIRAGEGIYVTPAALEQVESVVLGAIDRNGSIDLAGYRDLTQTSRKYAQAMLELLDQRRVTRRVGDRRIRYRSAGNRAQGDDA